MKSLLLESANLGRNAMKRVSVLALSLSLLAMCYKVELVQASILSVSFSDPVGDFMFFDIDLVGMKLTFDNTTGDYELRVNFDAANPFVDTFNVNANLLNGSINPLTTDPAFVNINERPTAIVPTTELVFTGTNSRLTAWGQGDQIANNVSIFGLPIDATFSGFGSGVSNFGQPIDTLEPVSSSLVPIPAAAWLFGSGLLGLIGIARRKRAV